MRTWTTVRSKLLFDRVKLAEAQAETPEARALEVINNKMATQGLGRSGAWVEARHERRLETVRSLLAERLRLEREQPLGSADVTSWHDDLTADINDVIGRNSERLQRELEKDWGTGLGGSLPDEMRRRLAGEMDRLRQEYLSEADLMKHESEVAPRGPAIQPSLTINVSGSQIASLNLGQIVGNIEATVSGLNAVGQPEIARSLKNLTEAIAADPGLDESHKREAIEVVADLGDELRKERRPSRLRAFAARIGQLVTGASTAYGAYEALRATARAAGVELP